MSYRNLMIESNAILKIKDNNLADNLIEPYRQTVDLFVYDKVINNKNSEFNSQFKHEIAGLLNADVLLDGEHHRLTYAVEKTVQSYVKAINNKKGELILPVLTGYEQHKYE